MDLWVEMKFDGVQKGPIEKLKQEAWAMFSSEASTADTAGDADTVDLQHASDFATFDHTHTETDPVFSVWDRSSGILITESQVSDLDHFMSSDETDPVFTGTPAFGITGGQITNWDAAFGWDDHAGAGYDISNDSWTGTGDVYTTSGNVGIGTTSPIYKLEVRGGTSNALSYFINDNNTSGNALGLYVVGDARGSTEPGYGIAGLFWGYGSSTSGNAYGTQNIAYAYGTSTATGVYSHATGGSTTGREWAFFGYGDGYFSGNVGIGTDNPTETLTVAGTIESTSGGIKFPDGTIQTTASAPTWHQILPASERFELVMNDEAVLDHETGLVWAKDANLAGAQMTWVAAINYCINDLLIGGRLGWRLPSIEELSSLVDKTQSNPALPSGHLFTNVQSGHYWSATTYAGSTTGAWDVTFGSGDVDGSYKTSSVYAWCVRGGSGYDAR
jgi:hypothetical protein